MEDQEILKRVAEIEGWEVDSGGFVWLPVDGHWIDSAADMPWSDLGPLIEKHKLALVFNETGFGSAPDVKANTWEVAPSDGAFRIYGRHESLRHAILLAIIEAHDERKS